MKKIEFIAMMLATILCLCSTSCSDDKEGRDTSATVTSSDPAGTVASNIRHDDEYTNIQLGTYIIHNNYAGDRTYSAEIHLHIKGSLNLWMRDATYNMYPQDYVTIASVGPVKNISEIKKVPETGWAQETSATPGNGYVLKYESENFKGYARVYVVDWITRTGDNGIIGVKIKYQVWEP
ncbi:MAG: hypothetical protein J6W49_03820 [Paludibacteraceae bacterium]|nr:hypothetical protein [Paludibacteraceae bacterium]